MSQVEAPQPIRFIPHIKKPVWVGLPDRNIGPDELRLARTVFDRQAVFDIALRVVGMEMRVCRPDIIADIRVVRIVRARHTLFYLLRRISGMSFPEIGRRVGSRDHTTVLNGYNRISALVENDSEFAAYVEAIERRIRLEQTIPGFWGS